MGSIPGRAKGDVLIAVDGGLDFCNRAGIAPDLAIGDWDSLKDRSLLKAVPQITLPRKKDQSDLYYALEAALASGAKSVWLSGFLGGRSDHVLGNYSDAAAFAAAGRTGVHLTFTAADGIVALISARRRFEVSPGQIVSVFAWGGVAEGVTLTGLEYPLKEASLQPSSRGLSNVAVSSKIEIKVRKGLLLVMIFDKRPLPLA